MPVFLALALLLLEELTHFLLLSAIRMLATVAPEAPDDGQSLPGKRMSALGRRAAPPVFFL